MLVLARFNTWWATAQSSVAFHRRAKWIWVIPGIAISFVMRDSIVYLVFLSVYAIITGHWSSEEAALASVIDPQTELADLLKDMDAKLDQLTRGA